MCGFPSLEQMSCRPISVIRLENYRLVESCAEHGQTDDLAQWIELAERVKTRKLYVDCSNVEYMSSEMLSRLMLLQRRMKQRSGELVLCRVRDEVRKLLAWTKLDRYFHVQVEAEEVLT